MVRTLLRMRLDAAERKLGAPVHYLRYMLEHDRSALVKFGLLQPATQHRKILTADVYHAARIVAARQLDCGECVQIEVNAASRAGVPTALIERLVQGVFGDDGPEIGAAVALAEAVVQGIEPVEDARETIRARFGPAGLIELSLAIVTAQAYPSLKRALGFARSCSLVPISIDG